jgi:hypothetical protein
MLTGLNHLTLAQHKLEAHVGDLASRLVACRERPYAGMKFFDDQSADISVT